MTNIMVTHLFAGNSITFILEFFFGGKSVSSATHPFRRRKRSWVHLTLRQHENWLLCGMSQVEGTRIFKWHAGDGTQIDAVAISGAVKLKQEIKADQFTSAFLLSDSIWVEDEKPSSRVKMIRLLLDILCWRRSQGRSSRWSASFPCRSRYGSRKHIPHNSSRDALDISDTRATALVHSLECEGAAMVPLCSLKAGLFGWRAADQQELMWRVHEPQLLQCNKAIFFF